MSQSVVVGIDPGKPFLHSVWNVCECGGFPEKPFPVPVISVIGPIPLPDDPVYCPTIRIEGGIAKIARAHFNGMNPEASCSRCYQSQRCCNSKYGGQH